MNFEEKTVAELRELAKEESITNYSKMTKEELILSLKGIDLPITKTWLEVFTANYNEESKEALELKKFVKETYKNDVYISWATMERLTYQQDPEAQFIVIENANGGLVHSDITEMKQYNAQKGEVISDTVSQMFSHTVKVALIFMGKEFIENYPIQDKDYEAARIYNQNLVNRALQRAKARVAARGTGLALRLYEGFDLQFDAKKEETPKKPDVSTIIKEEPKKEVKPKKEEKPEPVKEEKPEPVKEDIQVADNDIAEVIKFLRENDADKVNAVLQRINTGIMKKYNFALALTDTDEELAEKIEKFPEPDKFKKSLENMI